MLQPALEYHATPAVSDVLARLGRTEDLRFSPDKTQLAIAGFEQDTITLIRARCEPARPAAAIHLLDYVQFSSPALCKPHGMVFLDERTLVVANRKGKVEIFRLPDWGGRQKNFVLRPMRTLRGPPWRRLDSPGSVDMYALGSGLYRLLICDNYAHFVTSARVSLNGSCRVSRYSRLLHKALQIPDGINVSRNRRWIVVSNHGTGHLLVYRNDPALGLDSDPAAVLHGMDCPHGVRFADNDQKLVVVDSAAPTMVVYACGPQGWSGDYQPSRIMRVLDEATFHLGRYNVEEGGPKGIDIDSSAGVLAMTCEHRPLVFYDLNSILVDVPGGCS